VHAQGLTRRFGDLLAVDNVDLTVPRGQVYGFLGPNGSGKSTTIRMLCGLLEPSAGQIEVLGLAVPEQAEALRRRIGMIFQHFNLLSARTVAGNVAFPLELAGTPKARIDARVAELLHTVGLEAHAAKYPAQLSGGQKQRVGIARALATGPKILLCDEATSALDPQTTASVLALLSRINRELGLTIVLITHEMDVIRRVCDRVAVLDAGHLVESGPVSAVFLHPQHPTTRRFVSESEHVDEGELHRDFAAVGGRIVRLTFLGDGTYEPLLGRIARQTGVDYNILSGRIDRIKDTPYGQLTVALVGGDQNAAQAGFVEAGVHVEELRR